MAMVYIIFHPFIYEQNYFRKIGIKGAWLYQSVVNDKGEPLSVEIHEEHHYVNYADLVLVYDNIEKGVMQAAHITGEQYRFGLWKIGVGTPRKKLESVYRHVKKILDMPEDEFGVIDGGTWVYFEFDENDCISKVTLTRGL